MDDYISKGYAKKLSPDELAVEHEHEWYLPHHAVLNAHKPSKTRVVFDAAAPHSPAQVDERLAPHLAWRLGSSRGRERPLWPVDTRPRHSPHAGCRMPTAEFARLR